MEVRDEQLMLAFREGDAGAFEQLYRRHKGALFRFVLRGVRDRATAEELFQDIWMRVIEARGRYEVRAKFTTWLFTVAHNRLVDLWRRQGLAAVSLEELASADADPPAGPASEPLCQIEGREKMQRFAQALAALPPAQRETFLLHEEAGMGVADIAQATGASEEAAKSRLRYALAKLRAAIADD